MIALLEEKIDSEKFKRWIRARQIGGMSLDDWSYAFGVVTDYLEEVMKMRIAAIEEELRKLPADELDRLIESLDYSCKKLPEPLIQEMGLRTLWNVVKIVKMNKKGGE